jgi:hypothetical protein
MRYVRVKNWTEARNVTRGQLDLCGSIHASGSVRGMQKIYGWPRGAQVRIGRYIYNVGTVALQRLRDSGLVHGE